MTEPKKKKKRKVFGRLKGIEVDGYEKVFTFELTKQGLIVRPRSSKNRDLIPFNRLVGGGGYRVAGYIINWAQTGIEIRTQHGKGVQLVEWGALLNMAHRQPFLFHELAKKEEQ